MKTAAFEKTIRLFYFNSRAGRSHLALPGIGERDWYVNRPQLRREFVFGDTTANAFGTVTDIIGINRIETVPFTVRIGRAA